jgi:hypothetical protein
MFRGIGFVPHPRDPLALDGNRAGPRARVVGREDPRVPDQDSCHDRSRSRSASAIGEELNRDVDAVDPRRSTGFSEASIMSILGCRRLGPQAG